VTVLNMQSCKGLEFDAVFIVDLHESVISNLGADRFRMQMFVGVSRAREWVELLESAPVTANAPFLQELPPARILARGIPSRQAAAPKIASKPVTIPVVANDGAPAAADWAVQAGTLARKHGFMFEDLRPKGCVWVHAPESFSKPMDRLGFKYASRRNAWWRKQ
jgi:hypothetical protein